MFPASYSPIRCRLCGNPDNEAHPDQTPLTNDPIVHRAGQDASIFVMPELVRDAFTVLAMFALLFALQWFPELSVALWGECQ